MVRFHSGRPGILCIAGRGRKHWQPFAGPVLRRRIDDHRHRSHHQDGRSTISRVELVDDLFHGRDGSLRALSTVYSRTGNTPSALLAEGISKRDVASHRTCPARRGGPQTALSRRHGTRSATRAPSVSVSLGWTTTRAPSDNPESTSASCPV